MDLLSIKYSICPRDEGDGVLLVDIEEKLPRLDKYNQRQYYCMSCQHIFAVDGIGRPVVHEVTQDLTDREYTLLKN